MKLKIRTTAGAALGVAAMAAALSIGCGTLLNLGLPRILIVTGSVFTVMYLTARFCFNLFVRYRIKPIYLHSLPLWCCASPSESSARFH